MMEKMEKKEEREAGTPVKIGLVCCSNGLSESFKPAFQELLSVLMRSCPGSTTGQLRELKRISSCLDTAI